MPTADELAALDAWAAALLEGAADRSAALDALHVRLANLETALPKLTVEKYQCNRGCQIARVFKVSGLTLCAVRDYQLSAGLNEATSVAAARERRTINAQQTRWPGHVYDVAEMYEMDGGSRTVGIALTCRHVRAVVFPGDILERVQGVQAGRPIPPTRL